VHRYSRPVGLLSPLLILIAYSMLANAAETTHDLMVSTHAGWDPAIRPRLFAGLFVFFAGEILNFYHHRLLARLREPGQTDYKIPRGGLFSRIACPHYLFEIAAWIGYAIMSAHIIVFGLVFILMAYLVGRARRTVIWYRENMPDYPKERKALLPYVF